MHGLMETSKELAFVFHRKRLGSKGGSQPSMCAQRTTTDVRNEPRR